LEKAYRTKTKKHQVQTDLVPFENSIEISYLFADWSILPIILIAQRNPMSLLDLS
jgi:hypothetical protein